MLKLFKPIVFFDLETTGVSIQTDRIVQIAVYKIFNDLVEEPFEKRSMLINPGIPIPIQATEVHGITDEMVQDKPKFSQIAKSLKELMFGCDLGGYNSDNFDIPILIQEFHRCGIEFPDWPLNVIDGLKIERIISSHKLSETYKRHFGRDFDGAHDATADTDATVAVFFKQLERLNNFLDEPIDITIENIDRLCQGENERFDLAGKCYVKDGEVFWSFGKWKDHPVLEDRGYLNWVINSDFPLQTKTLLKQLLTKNN